LSSDAFASEVSHLKRELARLQLELRAADKAGKRALAIELLAEMLKRQSAFFERWRVPGAVPPPP
jgi:hypothetical protein